MRRIQGNWRHTHDRRIYCIEGATTESDEYVGTAASCDDAAAICGEYNDLHSRVLDAERQLTRALSTQNIERIIRKETGS